MKEISSLKLKIIDADQILNMGGPWIGTLFLGDDLISHHCIADNYIYCEDREALFFVKFNKKSRFHYYFNIAFYSLKHKHTFEFDSEFDIVYINGFINSKELEIYHAFHNHFESNKDSFNVEEESFRPLRVSWKGPWGSEILQ